jgi:hypothetical protein
MEPLFQSLHSTGRLGLATRVLFERLGLPDEPMVGSEGIKSNTAEFGSWVSDAVE